MPRQIMSRQMLLLSSAVIAALGVCPAVSSSAQTGKPAVTRSQAKSATPAEIARWIRALDADRFRDRQQATKQLEQAGPRAFGALVKAAQGDSAEVTARALRILTKAFRSSQAEVKAAAKTSLERLSKSSQPSASRQAKRVLEVAAAQRQAAGRKFGFGGKGGIQLRAVGARINIRGIGGGGGVQIQVKNVNGQKTIDATENGRNIHIEESPQGQITMRVTETVNGKKKVSTYKAANAAALKKKSPQAYKLYQKYAAAAGGVAGGGGFGRGFGAIRGIRINRFRRPVPNRAVLRQIQQAQQEIQSATRALRKLATSGKTIAPDAVRKLANRIAAAEKKLQTARKALAGP